MKTQYLLTVFFFLVLSLEAIGGCSNKGGKLLLVIPNAMFVSGKPSGTQQTQQKPVVTPPSTTTVTVGQTITWKVDFTQVTDINVMVIIIELPDLDGYFVVPLESTEVEAGTVDIPMYVSEEVDSTVCQRDYRGLPVICYAPASEGTTDIAFAAASVTDEERGTLGWSDYQDGSITVQKPDNTNHGHCEDGQDAMPCNSSKCTSMKVCCDWGESGCVSHEGYLVNDSVWFECASTQDCNDAAMALYRYCCQ